MFWERENAIERIEELAALHRKAGNLSQAKSLYACLIAMIKRKSGTDTDQLAVNFYRLAEIYEDEGKPSAAKIYYERATDVWRNLHPRCDENPFWYREALTSLSEASEQQDHTSRTEQRGDQQSA